MRKTIFRFALLIGALAMVISACAPQAPSAQNMRIFLLSELDRSPLYEGRLSDQSAEEIDQKFAARARRPTLLHVPPLDGLRRGRQMLSAIQGDGYRSL